MDVGSRKIKGADLSESASKDVNLGKTESRMTT